MTRSSMIALAAALVLLVAAPRAVADNEIQYQGAFELARNGDVKVSLDLQMPMIKYQRLRDSVSNLHLLMRDLASARAETEVVDRNSEWNDSERKLLFTMTWLGAARNLGNRWELEIPEGTTFSNHDEAKRTMFFNAAGNGPLGPVVGSEKLVFPAGAANAKWDNSRRVASWEMPEPRRPSGGGTLWALAAAALVLGATLLGVSFLVKTKPPA